MAEAAAATANQQTEPSAYEYIVIEPFYGGSHRQMIDLLLSKILAEHQTLLLTLPAKKWKWRLRTGSLYFSTQIPQNVKPLVLFCTSMLNLAELLALRPDLHATKKVLYFHENQFEYPVQPGQEKERDVQFGWSQVLSALVADTVLFNSHYNLSSFLVGAENAMRMLPKDQRIKGIAAMLKKKSAVVHFPIVFRPSVPRDPKPQDEPLHILWNQRWEWDKGYDLWFDACDTLAKAGLKFKISVLGEAFGEVPPEFGTYKTKLAAHILNWGYLPTKDDYFRVLHSCDVVVSTARHEFFGISVVEAIQAGCYPICPNSLVYPEYLDAEFLYNTQEQLVKKLRYFANNPHKLRTWQWRDKVKIDRFDFVHMAPRYREVFEIKLESAHSD